MKVKEPKPNAHMVGPGGARVLECEDSMRWPRSADQEAWANCTAALVARMRASGVNVRDALLEGCRMAGAFGALQAEELVHAGVCRVAAIERGVLDRGAWSGTGPLG